MVGNDFDRAMEELQQQVLQEALAYYSAKVVQEFYNPQNLGLMLEADGYGRVLGSCGDTMEMYLRLDGGKIVKAAFMTDGCGATIACGSMLTQMVEGKSVKEAAAVTPEELTEALDGLPPDHAHCAILAVDTLRAALEQRPPGDDSIEMSQN
ncbi:MAG: iron-sulfur cluster assembly scaffold protein [Chloroflexia bacterium]|nr:iron-sulfur cluster assembly scaffold protein [Chloroflexia bacterium]